MWISTRPSPDGLGRDRQRLHGHPVGQAEPDRHGTEVAPADGRGRAAGDDLLAEQDGHPVGQRLHLVHVVGGQQHGGAGSGQEADEIPGLAASRRVEAGGRLVEEEQIGVADDAQADVEAALLAARETS